MRTRSRDRLCLAIVAAALLVSTLVVGGVFRWTQAIVAILVALALLTQLTSRRRAQGVPPIVVFLGIAITLTVLQLVPVPHGLLAALNPHGSGLRDDGIELAHTAPWQCLSMDPAATLRGLAFLVTLLGVALLGLRLASSERGRFMVLGGVAITCGLVALVTGLHKVVHADYLYGIYEAPYNGPVLGPLIGVNELGSLMELGTAVAVGLAFYEKQSALWRALWIVIAVGCASICLMTESRGAAIALALAVGVTGTLLIARRLGDVAREHGRSRRRLANQIPIALVLIVGFGLAMYSSAGGVVDQLENTSLVELGHPTSKFAAWKSAMMLVGESPWVGVGRGAVESTFTRVFDGSAYATFSHLENEYVQMVVEWGIPGAFILGGVLIWCVVTALRRWRDGPLAAAALGSLAGIMFQSSVDFGVELLGVAVPVMLVVSTLQTVPLHETSKHGRLRLGRGVLLLALAGAALVLLLPMTSTLQEEHDYQVEVRPPRAELVASMERHPLDYYPYGQLGEDLIQVHDPQAVGFLNHALALHPFQTGLHQIVARLLVGSGRKAQGALEYALALRGMVRPHLILSEIVQLLPDPTDAALAIPVDYPLPTSILKSLRELGRLDVSERWLTNRVLARASEDLDLLDTLYDLAMERASYDVALRAATRRTVITNTHTSRLMVARVHFQQKAFAQVLDELADVASWRGRIDEHASAWLLVCDSHRERREWEAASECLHHLDGAGVMSMRHQELVDRQNNIGDERTTEIRKKQIQDLERSMGLPVDADLPVIHGVGSAWMGIGTGSGAISNPLSTNPLLNPLQNPLQNPPQNPLKRGEPSPRTPQLRH